ncbi:hypothetical protein [Agromyces cerinus]|uniref:hypothetical protein n=1 Tax=Agromyces cerinus TaxID=33878 RepID=UPI00117797C5|nr:hypothetical protein [Agromyces cerinus]
MIIIDPLVVHDHGWGIWNHTLIDNRLCTYFRRIGHAEDRAPRSRSIESAANVFGESYPGAGATIGQGLVYGHIVASHAMAARSVDAER